MRAINLPLRHYEGFMADSSRWERFRFRPDDVVISTPAKCGTTWMQTIVGMLLLDRTDLGAPISTISPWLDMQIRTEDEGFATLEAQDHRRFIKTHTPLDGVPLVGGVTYVVLVRHPLDVALSDRDHAENAHDERAVQLRTAAAGEGSRRAAAPAGDRPREVRRHAAPPSLRTTQPRSCGGSSITTNARAAVVPTGSRTTAT